MAEVMVGQRLGKLSPELGLLGVCHWHAAEWVKDGWDVGLLKPDIRVPGETWLFELLSLVLFEHTAIQPEAYLALSQVEFNANCTFSCRQKLLCDGVVLGHFLWIESYSKIYSNIQTS